ncbi:MAG: alpha/beta hydrolase fold protein [Pseudarthrobacter sp.]|nr:alpha/beta hydrolase fold protein [Pseudarthrobacter sp.]
MVSVAPGAVDPTSDDFTTSELERMRPMTIWNFGNAAVADESARVASNAAALQGVTYPENTPVLHFLASDSVAKLPDWLESHKNQLRSVNRHEIVELQGLHNLQWTQSKAMAKKIKQFLQDSVLSLAQSPLQVR